MIDDDEFETMAREILDGSLGKAQTKLRNYYAKHGLEQRRKHLRRLQDILNRLSPGLYEEIEEKLIVSGNIGVMNFEEKRVEREKQAKEGESKNSDTKGMIRK